MPTANECFVVYRVYDGEGNLLYVGTSGSLGRRVRQHELKPWFRRAARIDVEHHSSAAEAVRAEKHAIKTERPEANLALIGSPPGSTRKWGSDLLPPSAVAEALGCTEETVRRICRRGELGQKFGGRWLIRESELGPLAERSRGQTPEEG